MTDDCRTTDSLQLKGGWRLEAGDWRLKHYFANSCPKTAALLENDTPVSKSRSPLRTSFAISLSKYCMPSASPLLMASSKVLPSCSPFSTHSRVRPFDFSTSNTGNRPLPSARRVQDW